MLLRTTRMPGQSPRTPTKDRARWLKSFRMSLLLLTLPCSTARQRGCGEGMRPPRRCHCNTRACGSRGRSIELITGADDSGRCAVKRSTSAFLTPCHQYVFPRGTNAMQYSQFVVRLGSHEATVCSRPREYNSDASRSTRSRTTSTDVPALVVPHSCDHHDNASADRLGTERFNRVN